MRDRTILVTLSRRTPAIVVGTLVASLLAYWVDAPLWLPYGLAVLVGSLAIVLMAVRDRGGQPSTDTESPPTTNRSWIAHELAGKGSPSGSYLLGFFGLVTIMLTGLQGPYALPAWAALALVAAWSIANARYPSEEESES